VKFVGYVREKARQRREGGGSDTVWYTDLPTLPLQTFLNSSDLFVCSGSGELTRTQQQLHNPGFGTANIK
jgi:hypothetical protein